MRSLSKIVTAASAVAAVMGTMAVTATTAVAEEAKPTVIEEGKAIAFNRKKGNCLACHMIDGGNLPGNIGPPLIAMKARFPDKAKLRAQIWDATETNPNSMMIPFGKHRVLTEAEIDKVVEFVYSL